METPTPYSQKHGFSSSYEEIFPPVETSGAAITVENYKLKIMEKDKALFESAQTRKEQEKTIEALRRELESKNENNERLILQIDELTFNLHQYENLLNKNKSDMNELQKRSDEQITSLNAQRINLLKKIDELEKILTNTNENIKSSYKEYQHLENDNSALKDTINDKLTIISKYEGIFDQLKKDNKQIPSLKRRINDLETVLEQFKAEVNSLKEKNERLQCDKHDIENKLTIAVSENQKEKLNSNNLYRLNYEMDSLRKDYIQKEKENSSLSDKYKSIIKDSDNFVNIISCEIGQFTNFLENLKINESMIKLPLSPIKNFNSTGLSNTFTLKYEVIMKSIESLKNRTIDVLNANILNVNKLSLSLSDAEIINKKLLTDKEDIQKENLLLRQKLNEEKKQSYNERNSFETLNESYTQLKDNYIKLKNNYKDFTDKNERFSKDTKDFIQALQSKLKIKGDSNGTLTHKIIEKISKIIADNGTLQRELNEFKNKNDKMKEHIVQLKEENSEIKNQSALLEQSTTEKINHIESTKDSEMKQQKNTLYDKIKELTRLLEESNKLILSYEKEVKELKIRNNKLEHNLKMLTNSHIELEQNINNQNSSLHNEMDAKDLKYNNLLREVELKDIHIKSLEKLLNANNIQYDTYNQMNITNNQVGKIQRNNSTSNLKVQTQYILPEQENNSSSFIKNEEHEQELKKLMNCFGNCNTNNTNNNDELYNNINTTEPTSNENNSVINNKRIPGKLYSTKRK